MTENEVDSRDDEEEDEFVKSSKSCGLKAFFESFDLPLFFLIETKRAGAEIEKADDEELEESKADEEEFQIKEEDSQIKEATKIS